jgi:hypothetical protein
MLYRRVMLSHGFEKKMDLYGPLAQARRCLARWLREERLHLGDEARMKAAALLARYFLHEDQVTDQLMLSFLRHYSRRAAALSADIEDPVSVRMQLKALLDGAGRRRRTRAGTAATALVVVLALSFSAWTTGQRPITPTQQAELKFLVRRIAEADPAVTAAAAWKRVKDPLHVRSYQEIRAWDYAASRERLEALLQEAREKESARPGMGPVVNGQ